MTYQFVVSIIELLEHHRVPALVWVALQSLLPKCLKKINYQLYMIDQNSHLLDDLPVRVEAALVGDSQHATQLTEPGI